MVRSELLAGARDSAPAVPPGLVLAMLFGATAVEVGISPAAATAISVFTFAGAAQMAAVELLGGDAELSIVLLTILLINLRYVIYSASLSVQLEELSTRWRAVLSYALFDVNFALTSTRFDGGDSARDVDNAGHARDVDNAGPAREFHPGWYYVGATAPLVGSFAAATLFGALAGQAVGEELGLSFAIPLIFVALVVPRLTDRAGAATAVVAAAVAVAAAGLPFNAGLLVAAACGTAAGALLDRRSQGGDRDGGATPGGFDD